MKNLDKDKGLVVVRHLIGIDVKRNKKWDKNMLCKKMILQATLVMLYNVLILEAKIPSREFRKIPCYSDMNLEKQSRGQERQVKMNPRAKRTGCAEKCWLQYGLGPDNVACQTECPGPNIEDLIFYPIA